MEFLKKIKDSIYNPKFYQEILEKPFSYSLKYISLFASFVAVLGLLLSLFYVPRVNNFFNSIEPSIVENYPQELEVTISGGNVSTNVEEPYFIEIPDSWKGNEEEMKEFDHLIAIDTRSELSLEKIREYNSVLLVTQNNIIQQDSDGKLDVQPLKDVPDAKINKESIIQFSRKYSPILKMFYPIIAIFAVAFIAIFYTIYNLMYLLFASFLIMLVGRIRKIKLEYKKAYQIGLHLITLPVLLTVFAPFQLPFFFFSIILILLAFLNIQNKEETSNEDEKKEEANEKLDEEKTQTE